MEHIKDWLLTRCHISVTLKELSETNVLYISRKQLVELLDLSCLKNLSQVYADMNHFTRFPKQLKLPNLNIISLEFNQITEISDISNLHNLQELRLGHNHLCQFPEIYDLNITALYLDNNYLTEIPEKISQMKLTKLDISGNNISISPWIPTLEELWLAGNPIKHLQPINSLNKLQICNCDLEKIPQGLFEMPKLQILDISKNNICDIPIIPSLHVLAIIDCGIHFVPSDIVKCRKLTTLEISENQLAEFSTYLCKLPLQHLDISHNKISALPYQVGDFRDLCYLDIRKNKLNCLNPKLGKIPWYCDIKHDDHIKIPWSMDTYEYVRWLYMLDSMRHIEPKPPNYFYQPILENLF